MFPGLFPDGARVARLRNPIGYWNALALVAALAFPLGLWLAAGRGHARLLRATGVVLLYVAGIALVLTYSRAGIVVAAAGICLWLWLARDRFEGLAMLVAAGVPAVCVVAWASTQPGIVDHLQTSATRERAGAWFALALVLGVAAALGLSHYAAREGERLSADARRRWALRLGGALAAVAVGVVVAATVAIGGPGEWLDEFRGKGDVVQGSGRLGELSSNNRWTWWGESWDLFRDAPAGGHGAHTFEIARRPIRVGSVVTEEPHNVALQALAETGLAGLLLGLAAAALALLACREALRRLEGDERGAGAALAVLLPIYLLHALADIDWDFVAASAPVLFAVGVLLAAGRPAAEPRSRPVLAVVACVAGLGVLYSMTAPWLSQRRVEAAYEAIAENDVARRRVRRAPGPRSQPAVGRAAVGVGARRRAGARIRPGRCAGTRTRRSSSPRTPTRGSRSARTSSASAASATRTSTSTARTPSTRTGRRGCPAACSTRPARRSRALARPTHPKRGHTHFALWLRRPARPGPREPLARADDDRDVGAHEVLHA